MKRLEMIEPNRVEWLRAVVLSQLNAALVGVVPDKSFAPDQELQLTYQEFMRWRLAVIRITEEVVSMDRPGMRGDIEDTMAVHQARAMYSVQEASRFVVGVVVGVRQMNGASKNQEVEEHAH